jgi:hypothetical protein
MDVQAALQEQPEITIRILSKFMALRHTRSTSYGSSFVRQGSDLVDPLWLFSFASSPSTGLHLRCPHHDTADANFLVLKTRTVDRLTHPPEGSAKTLILHFESLRLKKQRVLREWAAATCGLPTLKCTMLCDQGGMEPTRLRLSRIR